MIIKAQLLTLVALMCATISPALFAQSYGQYATADSYVNQTQSNLNFGASPYLYTGYSAANGTHLCHVRFPNLSSIPAGATITGATLQLDRDRERTSTLYVEITKEPGERGCRSQVPSAGIIGPRFLPLGFQHRPFPHLARRQRRCSMSPPSFIMLTRHNPSLLTDNWISFNSRETGSTNRPTCPYDPAHAFTQRQHRLD